MPEIKRYLEEKISQNLRDRKILIIYGPRQVGKTTLVKHFLDRFAKSTYINGDFIDDQEKLNRPSRDMVKQFADIDLLVVDEAQRIEDIGIKLKVIFDELPKLKIIATGSSAFELSNTVNEPLTGRYFSYNMYPISFGEAGAVGLFELNNFMVYGSYPEVVTAHTDETRRNIIQNIATNYLFKDVLNIEYIKNPRSLEHILKALALQLGGQVSMNELATIVGLDTKTVTSYLDILEKLYIIFSLKPYFTNKRKSIIKQKKYYFYDLGIRNAIINDFTQLDRRQDLGQLWENFCVVERKKRNEALGAFAEHYFWRSYKGEEIDLIEVSDGLVDGFEFKWKERSLTDKIKNIFVKDLNGRKELGGVNSQNFSGFMKPEKKH
ncbi:MAG: ATP-binding protein [Candidatus Doudnabacteria bacterium]|nr:ATP-binding protein [Candidatus Doudnabacteria bacterium]